MKASTVAAAAAFLGSVSAQGWDSWSGSSSADPEKFTKTRPGKVTTPVEEESKPTTWVEWSSETTPEAETEDPKTWSEWSTTETPEAETTPDPAWSEWAASSTDPSDDEGKTWSEWSSPAAETTKDPKWGKWSTPAAETTKDPKWGVWSSDPAEATSTGHSWGAWDPSESKTTITRTRTQWVTVTVYPVDGGHTWSEWSGPTTDGVVVSTVTKTADEASWSAWASPVAAVADPSCKVQISLSYGQPIWFPTPVLAETANSTAWGEWDGASSTPAVATSTESWAAWESDPVDSTTATSWANWESTSTKPSEETTTATWGAWKEDAGKKVVDVATNWAVWSASTTGSSDSAAQTWGEWKQDSNGISANGNKFGMTYSPYRADSGCKDAATVSADIAALAAKGFTSVRVYSTDCQTLENVGKAARDNKIKVILGVFISETGTAGAQKQVTDIVAWAQWDLVELIVVGNEAVFGGRTDAGSLAGFIGSSKAAFKAAGYTGAVSTTDELSIWTSQGSAWCDVVDVVTANLYAFFNPNTAAEDAGTFIQAQIQELSQVCPGKEVYVMESGWPSAGNCNGKACPSKENQATAIKAIQAAVGAKIVFFSFEDELWKKSGQFGVEQHWGCSDVFN